MGKGDWLRLRLKRLGGVLGDSFRGFLGWLFFVFSIVVGCRRDLVVGLISV